MPRTKYRPETGKLSDAELDLASQAAAIIVDFAELHGFDQVTIHSAHGVHRLALTKISSKPPERDLTARRTDRRSR